VRAEAPPRPEPDVPSVPDVLFSHVAS